MLRKSKKLTQADLAKLIGTTPSVIARLENLQYDRHSWRTLRRIGDALGYDIEIRFEKRAPSPDIKP